MLKGFVLMCCATMACKLCIKHQATGLLKAGDPGDTPHKGTQKYTKAPEIPVLFSFNQSVAGISIGLLNLKL